MKPASTIGINYALVVASLNSNFERNVPKGLTTLILMSVIVKYYVEV